MTFNFVLAFLAMIATTLAAPQFPILSGDLTESATSSVTSPSDEATVSGASPHSLSFGPGDAPQPTFTATYSKFSDGVLNSGSEVDGKSRWDAVSWPIWDFPPQIESNAPPLVDTTASWKVEGMTVSTSSIPWSLKDQSMATVVVPADATSDVATMAAESRDREPAKVQWLTWSTMSLEPWMVIPPRDEEVETTGTAQSNVKRQLGTTLYIGTTTITVTDFDPVIAGPTTSITIYASTTTAATSVTTLTIFAPVLPEPPQTTTVFAPPTPEPTITITIFVTSTTDSASTSDTESDPMSTFPWGIPPQDAVKRRATMTTTTPNFGETITESISTGTGVPTLSDSLLPPPKSSTEPAPPPAYPTPAFPPPPSSTELAPPPLTTSMSSVGGLPPPIPWDSVISNTLSMSIPPHGTTIVSASSPFGPWPENTGTPDDSDGGDPVPFSLSIPTTFITSTTPSTTITLAPPVPWTTRSRCDDEFCSKDGTFYCMYWGGITSNGLDGPSPGETIRPMGPCIAGEAERTTVVLTTVTRTVQAVARLAHRRIQLV